MERSVEIELSRTETILLGVGAFGLLIAWFPRIYLFERHTEDRALKDVLDDHFVTQFADFFAFKLIGAWQSLSQESKRRARPYLATYLTAVALFLGGFISALWRSWV